MKYPQLVSTRAVSAISDWLVTQLEQLGVDASLVYSRLLLSLLHTPLQINALDLAEISEIKVHIYSYIYSSFSLFFKNIYFFKCNFLYSKLIHFNLSFEHKICRLLMLIERTARKQ